MNQLLVDALPELIATLVGVAVGGTLAFAAENFRQRLTRHRQAYILLRSLARELHGNHEVIERALPHFRNTPFGKSFFLTTAAWETALSTEELPNIIGFRLADLISNHYGILARLRHYGDLMVSVWLTPEKVDGYENIQAGFRRIIIEAMEQVLEDYPVVIQAIDTELRRLRGNARSHLPIPSATPSAFRMEIAENQDADK